MFVLTVDQQASRRVGDRVEDLLAELRQWGAQTGVARAFQRTVGDEAQGVLTDAEVAVEVALSILRRGGWSLGIGAGMVQEPLPDDVRAGSGEAFVLAREAVEAAKSRQRPAPIAVRGHHADRAAECEAVLMLVAVVRERRSPAGWAVVDALDGTERTQAEVAARLGITQQAVSQRLRAAMWAEEEAVRPVLIRLLEESGAWTI